MKKYLVAVMLLSGSIQAEAMYESSYRKIDAAMLARMQYSWRDDTNQTLKNPVPLEDLRYITVTHWGFDGQAHQGELVMHKLVADDIVEIFQVLFEEMFPIEQMKLVDEYQGSDSKSIEHNNSYALCVRYVACQNKWSNHAFGTAIDINPQQNPYVEARGKRYHIEPLEKYGTKYLDRSLNELGMIKKNNIIYNAFISRGWEWGGECFDYCVDLHHFQKVIPGVNKTKN